MLASKFNFITIYYIVIIVIGIFSYTNNTNAEDIFDINSINIGTDSRVADINNLEYLSYVGGQLPGAYYVDVFLNKKKVDNKKIIFKDDYINKKLRPEVTKGMLINWGVKNFASIEFSKKDMNENIDNFDSIMLGANYHYDFLLNRLDISIPQIGLKSVSRGYIDDKEWNDGINALFSNYLIRYDKKWNKVRFNHAIQNSTYTFIGLRSGLNYEQWRLRNHSTYSHGMNGNYWHNLQTYLERDIRLIKSHLILGETASDNGIMKSHSYYGVKLVSNENMLPQSQRGFAPIIMGIAQSNALIVVRQNGHIIYQTSVPPGKFALNDLYPTSSSGDLNITIEEANGATRSYIQPFSTVPMMQRAGSLKYSIDIGKYNVSSAKRKPNFMQASALYGLPYNVSLYGGFIISKDYQAYSIGSGLNLGRIGAISADITHATTQLCNNINASGQSYRVNYSKYLPKIGTAFSLASYRYSTDSYYDFSTSNNNGYESGRKKQQIQLSVSQSLADIGYLSLNGYQQYYWDKYAIDKNLTLSFSGYYNRVNYGISYSYHQQDNDKSNDEILSLNFHIPFDLAKKNNWLTYNYNTSKKGDLMSAVSMSGTSLVNNNLQYDISQKYNHNRKEYSNSVDINYFVSFGDYNAAYHYDPRYHSVNLAATGALLFHSDGLTAGRTMYDAAVLIKAKGINNLKINNGQSLYTDIFGYAVIPSVTGYERNQISVDTATLSANDDVGKNTITIVPTQGAIVLADFEAKRGARILLKLSYKGKLIAFGSLVSVFTNGKLITNGIVANDGEVYLSGIPKEHHIVVKWGAKDEQQCGLSVPLSLDIGEIQFFERMCQ